VHALPFDVRGKARAAAPLQAGFVQQLEDVGGLHRARFGQLSKAVVRLAAKVDCELGVVRRDAARMARAVKHAQVFIQRRRRAVALAQAAHFLDGFALGAQVGRKLVAAANATTKPVAHADTGAAFEQGVECPGAPDFGFGYLGQFGHLADVGLGNPAKVFQQMKYLFALRAGLLHGCGLLEVR
jgi:hypothetical protein